MSFPTVWPLRPLDISRLLFVSGLEMCQLLSTHMMNECYGYMKNSVTLAWAMKTAELRMVEPKGHTYC